MPKLTAEQKAQARKDLIDIHRAKVIATGAGFIKKAIQPEVDAAMRLLETLAIAAGVFDESEG